MESYPQDCLSDDANLQTAPQNYEQQYQFLIKDLKAPLQQWLQIMIGRSSHPLQIQQASLKIINSYTAPGFTSTIIDIIETILLSWDGLSENQLLLAAVSCLKNMFRSNWRIGYMNLICTEDRVFFIRKIIPLNQAFSSIPNQFYATKYLKLMKDIIEITGDDAIIVYREILQTIEQNRDNTFECIPVCLNILLGISGHISTLNEARFSQNYSEMIRTAHPYLFQFAKYGQELIVGMHDLFSQIQDQQQFKKHLEEYNSVKRKYEYILYLSIKLMCKAINSNSVELFRDVIAEWARVVLLKLSIYHQEQPAGSHPHDMGTRGSDRFNFYHGKKWAFKFLERAMGQVFVFKAKQDAFNKLTTDFYKQNCEQILSIFMKSWSFDEPQRITFQRISCFKKLINSKPIFLCQKHEQELKLCMRQILPKYMQMTQKQLAIIDQDPLQFIKHQQGTHIYAGKVNSSRMEAVETWLRIVRIEVDQNIKNRFLKYALQLITQWTQGYPTTHYGMVLRDIACFLLYKLKSQKKQLVKYGCFGPLVNKIVVQSIDFGTHEFQYARAFDLLDAYSCFIQQEVLQYARKAVLSIFQKMGSLESATSLQKYVLIKGSKFLQATIRRCQILSDEVLGFLILKLFELMKASDSSIVADSINRILCRERHRVGNYADLLVAQIKGLFERYHEYAKNQRCSSKVMQFENMARGVSVILARITQLIQSANPQVVQVVQDEICKIVGYALQKGHEQDLQSNCDVYHLMSHFLAYHPKLPLSPQVEEVCSKVILRMAGFRKSARNYFDSQLKRYNQLSLNDPQNTQLLLIRDKMHRFQYYIKCSSMSSFDLEEQLRMVRSYIFFLPFGQRLNHHPKITQVYFKENTQSKSQYLFYLIERLAGRYNDDQWQFCIQQKSASLLLLIYYYEHHKQSNASKKVHPTVNSFTIRILLAMHKQSRLYSKLSKYTAQLFCLWLFETQSEMFLYFQKMNQQNLMILLRYMLITEYSNAGLALIDSDRQRRRCIFGICTLLNFVFQIQILYNLVTWPLIQSLLRYAVIFVYYNCVEQQSFYEGGSLSQEYWEQEGYDQEQSQEPGYKVENMNNVQQAGTQVNVEQEYDGPWMYEIGSREERWQQDQQQNFIEQDIRGYYADPLESFDQNEYLLQTLNILYSKNKQLYQVVMNRHYAQKLWDILQANAEGQDIPQNYRHLLLPNRSYHNRDNEQDDLSD